MISSWIGRYELSADDLCLRIALTLLHFLWQGAVIGAVAVVVAQLLRQSSASFRYVIYTLALLCFPVCVAVTFPLVTVPNGWNAIVGEEGDSLEVPSREVATPADSLQPLSLDALSDQYVISPFAGEVDVDNSTNEQPVAVLRFARWSPVIAGFYFFGASLFLLRLIVATWGAHRLRVASQPIEDPKLLKMFAEQARKVGLRLAPSVAYCERVAVPMVIGVLRPAILLPASMVSGLDPNHFAAIVSHELAHIRRFDLLMNLIQRLVESLLFFHPVVWYISYRMSAEREACCDDIVVATGYGSLEYAGALLQMAELCCPAKQRSGVTVAASGASASQFEQRVLRLLDSPRESRLRLSRGGVFCLALLVTSIIVTLAAILNWVDGERRAWRADGSDETGRLLPETDDTGSDAVTHEAADNDSSEDWNGTDRVPGVQRLLYVQSLGGGNTRQLVSDTDYVMQGSPAWSQDGKKVVYDAGLDSWEATRIFIVDAGGGKPTDLGEGKMPSFSPDGKRIAFSWDYEGIAVMNVDGSNRQVLAGREWGIQWSPDGTMAAFGKSGNVAVLDLATMEQRTVLRGELAKRYSEVFWNLGWSQDSKRIGFKAQRRDTGKFEIAVVPVSGDEGGFRVIWEGADEPNGDISWHPDSRQVMFAAPDPLSKASRLFVAHLGGNVQLRSPFGAAIQPAFDSDWSPDGQHIIFAVERAGRPLTAEGLNRRRESLATIMKHDFANDELTDQRFSQRGHATPLVPGAGGLRVVAPGADDWTSVRLTPQVELNGDFDVAVSFDILRLERAAEGQSTTIFLYVELDDAAKTKFSLGFGCHPNGRKQAFFQKKFLGPDGEQRYRRIQAIDVDTVSGLRIARHGERLSCLMRVDKDEYVISQLDTTTAPAVSDGIRLAVHTGGAGRETEVLWKHLEIRASEDTQRAALDVN